MGFCCADAFRRGIEPKYVMAHSGKGFTGKAGTAADIEEREGAPLRPSRRLRCASTTASAWGSCHAGASWAFGSHQVAAS